MTVAGDPAPNCSCNRLLAKYLVANLFWTDFVWSKYGVSESLYVFGSFTFVFLILE